MTISMYQASVPVFQRMLKALDAILDKAVANATERKIDPAVLVAARLAPDMYPLARQVQIASDHAKGCSARLAGVPVPSFEDTEKTFPDLKARIAKTLDFIATTEARADRRLGGARHYLEGSARASSPSRGRTTCCSSPCRTSIST